MLFYMLKCTVTITLHSRTLYCNIDMRYDDVIETHDIKVMDGDKYIHEFMLSNIYSICTLD